MRKAISYLLTLAMCLSFCAVPALAAEEAEQTPGGETAALEPSDEQQAYEPDALDLDADEDGQEADEVLPDAVENESGVAGEEAASAPSDEAPVDDAPEADAAADGSPEGAAVIASGTCGDKLTWTLTEDGTLTVSGTGEMYDYDWDGAPWYSCRNSITSVVVEQGVTSIGDSAFSGYYGLTSVTLPEGLESIGSGAFYGCSSLTSVTLPEGLTSIGSSAFCYCYGLTSVTLPEGLTSIGSEAFRYCSSLTSVTIPESVTSIGSSAFSGCFALETVVYNGKDWEDISISNGNIPLILAYKDELTGSCGDELTWTLTRAGTLTISGTGEMYAYNWGGAPWYGGDIASVVVEQGVTSIGDYAFLRCGSLTSVALPKGLTSIGSSAFDDCYGLTSVTLPEGLTSIGSSAFCYCSGLTSVTLPDTLTSIGDYAFRWCENLRSVTIGSGVTSIGDYAFDYCTGLTEVNCDSAAWDGLTIGSGNENLELAYCGEVSGTLCEGLTWKLTDEGVLTISGNGAMEEYDKSCPWSSLSSRIASVVVEEGVTSIGNRAFSNCSSLTSVTIQAGVTSVGYYAFYGCSSLTEVKCDSAVWDSLTIYSGNEDLKLAYYGELTGDCGPNARWTLTKQGHLTISGSGAISTAPAEMFYDRVRSVSVENGIGKIGWWTFAWRWNLTELSIADTVTEIEYRAFYGCYSLAEVTVPDSVQSLGELAFVYCYGLEEATVGSGVTELEYGTFYDCTSLASVTLPAGLTSIGEGAFYNCNDLTDVYFGGTEAEWNALTIEKGNDPLLKATVHFGGEPADPLDANGDELVNELDAAEFLKRGDKYSAAQALKQTVGLGDPQT